MFETVLIILIAGAVAILAAMRFIAAVRKLASREPDTRNTRNTRTPSGHSHNYSELALRSQGNNTRNTHNARNTHASSRRYDTRRQDKPPLVFWAVASPLLAAACVTVILLML
ncbi:MAG: hypothetical protein E3J71_09365 [Candidatus Stahlbacteria bacterium]|nr:MAG: hypothetical protein E3J71_09365 [Candidatus Stahlbacteria bacterium]